MVEDVSRVSHNDTIGFDGVLDATTVIGRVVLRLNELAQATRQVRELLRAVEGKD